MKATRKRIVSTHLRTDGCYFCLLSAYFVFVLPKGVKIYFIFTKEEFKWNAMRNGKRKTMWPKETGRSNTTRTGGSNCLRLCDIQQRVPGCCERKSGWLTEPLQITEIWLLKPVIGGRRIFLTKMCYHRRQGRLPKLVTKIYEMPTTFESSVVK